MTLDQPREVVKVLAKYIREHVHSDWVRHEMINMVSCLGAHIFTLEGDLLTVRDEVAELREQLAHREEYA